MISSTHVRHRVGLRDETWRSPLLEDLWIARMPADHAGHIITGADEMKWMRWVWRNGGMKFVPEENGRNPEKNLPRASFVHHETHMEWPRRELGTPAMGGERLTACATRPPKTIILPVALVVLYGCETWSLTLREEHRLRVFENKVCLLRKVFGTKRD